MQPESSSHQTSSSLYNIITSDRKRTTIGNILEKQAQHLHDSKRNSEPTAAAQEKPNPWDQRMSICVVNETGVLENKEKFCKL